LSEVLHPYKKFEEKLKRFEEVFNEFVSLPIEQQFPDDLEYYQQSLGLHNKDVFIIKQSLIDRLNYQSTQVENLGQDTKNQDISDEDLVSMSREQFIQKGLNSHINFEHQQDVTKFSLLSNQDNSTNHNQMVRIRLNNIIDGNQNQAHQHSVPSHHEALTYDQAVKIKAH
jgi:hypothetical protein